MWFTKYLRDKNMKIFLLILSGCLLLTGCQKEPESEEQSGDISGNSLAALTDEIKNIEALDVEMENVLDENMAVISVLGKEELRIKVEQLYKDESRPGYLDNRFTPEEIDIILSTIEGSWIVDEYVGFAPYSEVEQWMGVGNYEEKRERYKAAKERAEKNPPDFFFQIKSDGDKDSAVSDHYIYVHSETTVYASPISIVLSRKEENSQGNGKTIQGAGIPRISAYPVIYIDFISISCSEEGIVFYEPATLVLASDGSFLLLKDGAFYSLKNSIQGNIRSGDFSCLKDEDWERMQESYERQSDLYEWRQLDLNGDGIEDLILQEKETTAEDSNQHRILGIFACEEDGARCVLWDDVYMGEFSFCGPTGELMFYYYSFGSMVDVEGYEHYCYDEEWNEIIDYRLQIWYVDSPDEGYNYPTEWFETHPDMREEGIYYRKYEGAHTGEDTEGEALTLEELKEIFRTEMGMEIDYSR